MRQATLLILDRVYVSSLFSQEAFLHIRKQLLTLQVEHARYQIGSIDGLLARLHLVDDFRPSWVGRESQKEGRLPMKSNNRHGVLIALLHEAITARERRWEDGSMAKITGLCGIAAAQVIREATVHVRKNLLLIRP